MLAIRYREAMNPVVIFLLIMLPLSQPPLQVTTYLPVIVNSGLGKRDLSKRNVSLLAHPSYLLASLPNPARCPISGSACAVPTGYRVAVHPVIATKTAQVSPWYHGALEKGLRDENGLSRGSCCWWRCYHSRSNARAPGFSTVICDFVPRLVYDLPRYGPW